MDPIQENIAPIYPYRTYLYAATPRPRPSDLLGQERCQGFSRLKPEEQNLSLGYQPDWQTWVLVNPNYSGMAERWAEAASRRGYYVVYPLAHHAGSTAEDIMERKRQSHILTEALKYWMAAVNPKGVYARRRKLIRKFKYLPRPVLPEECRVAASRLPLFPGDLPDMGTPMKLIHYGRERWRLWRINLRGKRLTEEEKLRKRLTRARNAALIPQPKPLQSAEGPFGL